MKQIFTLKYWVGFGLLLLVAGVAHGQATTCNTSDTSCSKASNIENFNNSDGGFTTSNASFAYAVPTGDFRVANSSGGVQYTIKSRNYTLPASATSATIGFTANADSQFTRPFIVTIYSADGTQLAQCGSGKLDSGNVSNQYCLTISNPNLQKAGGNLIYYAITFTTQGRTPGAGGSLVFDDFKTNAGDESPLPVTFAGFEGQKTAEGIVLTWQVTGESNVKEYDVQRSTNGNNGFITIGSVPATGSSSYTFTDASNLSGTVVYRIKSVDNDGRFQYSSMISFRNGLSTVVFRVVPTLVINQTTVQHAAATAKTIITLISADGRLVRSLRPAPGAVQTPVDMTGLQPGLYLLRWSDGAGNAETVKLVKQ